MDKKNCIVKDFKIYYLYNEFIILIIYLLYNDY